MKNRKVNYAYYEHSLVNNLFELLEMKYKSNPDDIAFSYHENNLKINKTFKDVYNEVLDLSKYFYKNYKNTNIGIIGENSYNWIITYLAIIISGNVAVLYDKDIDFELLKKLIKTSDTKAIYYSKYYNEYIKDMKIKSFPLEDIYEYIKVSKNAKNEYEMDNDKTACIFFTSGTTGIPKGVELTNRNITYDIYAASSIFKPVKGVTVSILPYHHAFGLITAVLKPFYYDMEIYISTSLMKVNKDFEREKPTTLFLVPAFIETFYKRIWKSARKTGKDKKLTRGIKISDCLLKLGIDLRKKLFKDILDSFGGNLTYIICGGAYLDPKYVTWFRSIGIEILNGYGITECSPVISVNRNEYYRDGSVGQPVKGIDVKIIDDEICVKGPIVMKGYYKNKKETEKVLSSDGYFHTGDLGYIDKDGFIFITGRSKNLIILSNGENISPEVIEEELLKDEGVEEVVVYEKDKHIIASIYPSEKFLNNQEYFDNLIKSYNSDKPINHSIVQVKLRTTEFIKNNNRKILRNKVEEENEK